MNAVFADTSLLVAFVSERDEHHTAAAEFIRSFEGRIVTTDWVLLELGNYLAKTKHRSSFLPFLKQLQDDDRFRIVSATHDLFMEGAELYAQRSDKDWSLTDCVSFVVMGREGIRQAMTADHHFEQAGFTILLK